MEPTTDLLQLIYQALLKQTYLWMPGGQTTQTATGLAPGTYTVTVTDTNGCTDDEDVVITEPGVLSATVNSADLTCYNSADGTITISSPSGGYGTYEYTINGGANWQSGGSFTGLASNTYDVRIRDAANTSCVITLNGSLFLNEPPALVITASSGANGTVAPAGNTTVNCGANQTYTITPNACYKIASLTVDGSPVAVASSYTFTNVTANHTINATFALVTYTITVTSSSANGTITPTGTSTVNCGNNITYNITPRACHQITSLKVDGSPVPIASSYTFTNVTANHTISATFAIISYTITASSGPNGTVTPTGTSTFFCGNTKTYAITPNACYQIATLTVDGSLVPNASTYKFTNLSANHTISATFQLKTYSIVAPTATNGTVAPDGISTVNCGANKTYTITPDACYKIASLTVDGSPVAVAPSYTFTNVTADHTISATFEKITYTITASSGANGTVTPAGNSTVNCGADITYTITPNTCYKIASVTVDGSPVAVASSYTFTNVTANHSISATFVSTTYTITSTSASSNGTVTPAGSSTVNCGDNKTYNITPRACHKITSITVDGSPVPIASTYTFTNVTANHTISANFAAITYTIAASSGGNGTVTPAGTSTFFCGNTKTYAITPNACYQIASITVDGAAVPIASTYKFTTLSANHTISATFSPIPGCGSRNSVTADTKLTDVKVSGKEEFMVKVFPNPSSVNFKLQVQSSSNEHIDVRVTDAAGRVLGVIRKVYKDQVITIGDDYTSGSYFADVQQGKNRKVVKLIKVK